MQPLGGDTRQKDCGQQADRHTNDNRAQRAPDRGQDEGQDAELGLGGGRSPDPAKEKFGQTDLTDGGIDIMTALVRTGLCASKSEARRNIQQGGVSANDERITDIAKSFAADELKNGVIIRRGKKNYNKIILK